MLQEPSEQKILWFIKINCKPKLKHYVKEYCNKNSISVGRLTKRLLYNWIKEEQEKEQQPVLTNK